jgi:hypothetical protein
VDCAAWNIWKERNEFVIQNQPHSFGSWKVRFQCDMLLYRYEVMPTLVQPLIDWLLQIFV